MRSRFSSAILIQLAKETALGIALYVLGFGQCLLGISAYLVAGSALHELTAAVLFGSGVIAVGLSAILGEVTKR